MLEIDNVSKSYYLAQSGFFKQKQQVIKQVSFSVQQGETVGLVGESGSGKSTLARLILGLEKPDSGTILFNGQSLLKRENRQNQLSVVFQDYRTSLNPNRTVYDLLAEPFIIAAVEKHLLTARIEQLLAQTAIASDYLNYYPHQLSGGLAQRVCIARAIANKPTFIIFDEAISSLDISAQVDILLLLRKLKEELNITSLFISHDIQAVSYLCDRIIFFEKGQIVEQINVQQLGNVCSEYAKKLLTSVIDYE